ncbi:hypothetical protein LTR27_004744 [Elasticomyces elasticus]|nr:hypothetical protein LTR27_004744 [Elasticomyces elasticus]
MHLLTYTVQAAQKWLKHRAKANSADDQGRERCEAITDFHLGSPIIDSTRGPVMSELFGIVELLEMIFLGLSTRDVLCNVQRTCSTWKSTVESSKPIQEALFFRPISEARLRYNYSNGWEDEGRRLRKLESGLGDATRDRRAGRIIQKPSIPQHRPSSDATA